MTFRVLALFLTGVLLAAQPPNQQRRPGPPPFAWWENPVANGLQLTDEQMNRVNKIRKDHTDLVLQKREAVERAEADLAAIFDSPKIEWPKARPAVDALALARGELTKEMSVMMLRMRSVLTIDQWKMLEARLQPPPDRDGKGRGRGYRGQGGPGSGPGFNERKQ